MAVNSEEGKNGLGDYIRFPACGIKIRQPVGFEKAESFDGFGQSETMSSVMAVTMPEPYSEVAAGFTQEQLRTRGLTLRSREDVKVDGLPGILVHFEQHALGQVFLKWSLIFGHDQMTTTVTTIFPKAQERQMSAQLKAAMLSARLDRAAVPLALEAGLPFTIMASPKLKLAPGISRTLSYTKDGVGPAKSPKDPFFIAAPSLGKVVTADERQFAEGLLRETAYTKSLVVKSTAAITIDGLNGFESLAVAEDADSGTPLTVYQVVLFEEGSYFHMKGLVGTELQDEYLPAFKAMAHSFRKKRP